MSASGWMLFFFIFSADGTQAITYKAQSEDDCHKVRDAMTLQYTQENTITQGICTNQIYVMEPVGVKS